MKNDGVPGSLRKVLEDIAAEREAQDRMWGHQDFPDGSGSEFTESAEEAKQQCAAASSRGDLTWRHILTEEFFEALAESDPEALRAELVQTAAVAVKWIQSLDRRRGAAADPAGGEEARKEKLVRDRIPEIVRATGRRPETRTASPGEYSALLHAKLYEEADEYTAAEDPAELSDLLEVIHALGALHGLTPRDLEQQRSAKEDERGGFSNRLVLRLQD
ncbi:hypothetical protein ACN3XK_36255 [Actinomadura welshii]